MQVFPRVQACIMPVREHEPNRVASNRLDALDLNIALADLEHLLTRAMTAHFSRWRVDTQKLAGQSKDLAVRESDLEDPGGLMQCDLSWLWRAHNLPATRNRWPGREDG